MNQAREKRFSIDQEMKRRGNNADGSLSVKAPAMTAKAEVDVDVICYVADAPAKFFVVGEYHYHPVAASSQGGA